MSTDSISAPKPFSRFDERFYTRLAFGSGYDARALWRILHARLAGLDAGVEKALTARCYEIPSLSTEGRVWLADLRNLRCRDKQTGKPCPNQTFGKSLSCVHIEAGLVKEQNLHHDRQGVVMLPSAQRPVEAMATYTSRTRFDDDLPSPSAARTSADYRPRRQVEL